MIWLVRTLRKWSNDIEKWWYSRNSDDDTSELAAEKSLDVPDSYTVLGDKKYSMLHASIGYLLEDGSVTLYSHKFPYVETAMFIAHTFCAKTGVDINSIGCLYERNYSEPDKRGERERLHTSGRLMFKAETYHAFTAWLAEYKKRFSEDYDCKELLPIIKDGENVSGYFVDHNLDYEPRRGHREHEGKFLYLPCDELFDEWQWMLNNATGRVRILHDKWVFEEASDAMMYQLQMR